MSKFEGIKKGDVLVYTEGGDPRMTEAGIDRVTVIHVGLDVLVVEEENGCPNAIFDLDGWQLEEDTLPF